MERVRRRTPTLVMMQAGKEKETKIKLMGGRLNVRKESLIGRLAPHIPEQASPHPPTYCLDLETFPSDSG
jgi:P pilus assembly chaperone PapD